MGKIEDRLQEFGESLPPYKAPVANYLGCKRSGDLLAIVKDAIGDLDLIESVEKVQGFVRSASTFTQQPQVINGASDLLVELFGEAGRHTESPFNLK
jgi:hypothetical protein